MTLPTGGGAIRGIGEKFEVNAVTGTAGLTIPLPSSPARGGQGPQISLSYSSGGGNGPFGLGFDLSVPMITRKTDKGLPRYLDQPDHETDTFLISGAEDLVPTLKTDGTHDFIDRGTHHGYLYRPRIEGLFARIERIVPVVDGKPVVDATVHWQVTTPDNVIHIYGKTADARLVDPNDELKVFTWYLQETRDDKGNVTVYEYKKEDGVGVDASQLRERSRFDHSGASPTFLATAACYLKRVLYGNKVQDQQGPFAASQFLFELVFDYGEHASITTTSVPTPNDGPNWTVRPDAFSSRRSGFEVRTYRLCQRVLMFHRIDTPAPLLVRATEFQYEEGESFSYLRHVTQVGVKDAGGGNWERAEMPRLSLDYQRPELHDELTALPEKSLEGLTGGTDGGRKRWIDLDGEGIPGVLVDQGGGWFYKENRGEGDLKAPRRLHAQPNPSSLVGGSQTLEDIDGDGRLELVARQQSLQGYFARTTEGDFEPLRAFETVPNINWQDPNLRIIDLDGDGFGDILITEDQAFVWYRSRAKKGYEESKRVPISFDENQGPRVVFSDAEQSIQLADMCGDGLVDIVRIRNGEVSYWPNLGYGRFGKKITLENSPRFTTPEEFHASRVRFGDVDGSGTSDLFYLGSRETKLYFNAAGNKLQEGVTIRALPPVDNVTQVTVADLLGTGTSCLVWSSPIANPSQSVFYVDLMGSKKPHLLTEVKNNLGAVTRTTYASSTKFYLEDKRAGIPWFTRLPFPVQVVERMEREDAISGGKFVSRYKYRHGFFDGYEREFRGFARVETLDAEDFAEEGQDPLLYQSPVKTISWFHTGAWLGKERLEIALAKEYFQEGPPSLLVEDSPALEELDSGNNPVLVPITEASIQDAREAARALKGSPLRTEVYAMDEAENPDLFDKPYVITETNQQVRRLQKSRGENRYGVFFAYSRESVTISSERNLSDPRVGHQIALEVDQYGTVKRSASLVYGRATGEPEQMKSHITLSEVECVHQDSTTNLSVYRLGTQIETRAYEVKGVHLNRAGGQLITVEELKTALGTVNPANDLDFDQDFTSGVERRLLDRQQQTFYVDSFTLSNAGDFEPGANVEAPVGQVGLRALPYRTYQLALTPGQVSQLVTDSGTLTGGTNPFDPALLTGSEGRYVDREGSGHYWAVSGRAVFNPEADQFYLPAKAFDPFGGESNVTWDSYKLLPVQATDPVENVVQSTNDYRVLAPKLVTDPNLNRSEVEFDALGMVVATAVMGKVGSSDGDVITEPTTRLEYDLLAYQDRQEPAFAKTIAREKHGTANPRFQESYAYSDGFGRVIQQKVQAEEGEAPLRDANGELQRDGGGNFILGNVTERWVGTGRTVFNNKGNPVKQYEPFFSFTSGYEPEEDLVNWGVTPIIRYDSIDRVVRTDLPDGTFTKVEFDSWSQSTFDQNDTVLESDWYSSPEHGSPNRDGPEPSDPDQRAAWLSAQHADTPTVVHLDSLGRPYKSVAHNVTGTGIDRVEAFYTTTTELDIEGNTLSITDARGNTSIEQVFDVLGRRLKATSPDAGERLSIQDVGGKPLRAFNSRGFTSWSQFDAAQRPTHSWVKPQGATEMLVARMSYGESLDAAWVDGNGDNVSGPSNDPNDPSPAQRDNLRGQVHLAFETAGKVKTEKVDFKGNVLRANRVLATGFKPVVDPNDSTKTLPTNVIWNDLAGVTDPGTLESTAAASLEAETFTTETAYDALNRVTQSTSPDGTITTPTYNEANLLESSSVDIKGGGAATKVVFGLDYNARGQRLAVSHNDTDPDPGTDAPSHSIEYEYDEKTFRVTRIETTRAGGGAGNTLQKLRYTYDAVGNITEKRDEADWDPDLLSALNGGNAKYTYDALYRLTRATGREHAGQQPAPKPDGPGEPPYGSVPHGNDLSGMRDYVEETTYDEVGNILKMRHLTGPSNSQTWERNYDYATDRNRLLATSIPGDLAGQYSAPYSHDIHGNMVSMPHLPTMTWDFADRLQSLSRLTVSGGSPDQMAYYTYDSSGQRVRKVYEHSGVVEERIYLGSVEIYRKRHGGATDPLNGTVQVERETHHVMDDTRRVAMAETLTIDLPGNEPTNVGDTRWRYQLDNHLGSSAMEIDGSAAANVISYEEFHPYGTTAFHLSSSSSEVSAKRYRYSGKEKDEESGLYYHGARYYAPWLGRWTAADPIGAAGGLNFYEYSASNPVNLKDPNGLAPRNADGSLNDADPNVQRLRAKGASDSTIQDLLDVNPRARKAASPGTSSGGTSPASGAGASPTKEGGSEPAPGGKTGGDPSGDPGGRKGGKDDKTQPGSPDGEGSSGGKGNKGASKGEGGQGPEGGGERAKGGNTSTLAEISAELTGEGKKKDGSSTGAGGTAEKGALLDNKAGQLAASLAVIGDAIASVINLGKLAIKGIVAGAKFLFKKGLKPLGQAIGRGLKKLGGFFKNLFRKQKGGGGGGGSLDDARGALTGVLRARALKEAGFAEQGVPIILDENLAGRGIAAALRAKGFNVRDVFEIPGLGKSAKDPDIRGFAEAVGARVLTADRGRQIGEGFEQLAIQVDNRVGRDVNTLARILEHALK